MRSVQSSPRSVAWQILNRLSGRSKQRIFLDREYSRWIDREGYDQRERALLVGLVRGVVKHRMTLQLVVKQWVRNSDNLPAPVLNLLLMGAYQLASLTRMPAYAVVDESVRLAAEQGYQGFTSLVNAVLRNLSRQRESLKGAAEKWGMDLPDWLEEEWREWIGQDELTRLKTALARPPVLKISPGFPGEDRQELAECLMKHGGTVEPDPFSPQSFMVSQDYETLRHLPEYIEGRFFIQDSGSLMVIEVLNPQPGETIIEIGCGNGGKTLQIGRLMENRGILYALDVNRGKLETLKARAQRVGLDSIRPQLVSPESICFDEPIGADRVLIDAPCSGLGTLRRNPEIAWTVDRRHIDTLVELQVRLVLEGFRLVKAGGLLVYSVCTLTRAETTGVIERFERSVGDACQRVSIQDVARGHGTYGPGNSNSWWEIWPHQSDSDGFFIAVWRKKWL